MICIDSNILIHAFNVSSDLNKKASLFISEKIKSQKISICDISLIEFFQIVTNKNKLEKSLSTDSAQLIIKNIINNQNFNVLYGNETNFKETIDSLDKYKINKYEIYDHLIANTCKYYTIKTFFTVNVKDFKKYPYFETINPLI